MRPTVDARKQRYRAVIEYDGTDYCGFQRQRQGPTIQEELEQVIRTVAQQRVTVLAAGRTDRGVHALGQVIAFDLVWGHEPEALQRALNAALPRDVAVIGLELADNSFHPRFSARRRAYRYHIYNHPVRSPLHKRQCWHVSRPLDVALMNAAATSLVGVHDFATFGRPPKGENTVRRVFRSGWRREAELLVFDIEADAFLFRMVRSLVGTMKAVGERAMSTAAFAEALASGDRRRAGQTAPPQGLFLVSVTYDDE